MRAAALLSALALSSTLLAAPAGADPAAPTPGEPTPELITIAEPWPALAGPTDTASLYEAAGLDPALAGPDGRRTARTTDGTYRPSGQGKVKGLPFHVAPSCSGTGQDGLRVQVLYVREASDESRLEEMRAAFLEEIAHVDDILALASDQPGEGRRVRWLADANCVPSITEAVVPDNTLRSFDDWWKPLAAAGYDDRQRKYLTFTEGARLAGSTCGIAHIYEDDRPGQENHNNGNQHATYARVDSDCWLARENHPAAFAHELLHMLGAVQDDAPHATGYGHCTDSATDVMCYTDGSNITPGEACSDAWGLPLDCGEDDYFSISPAAGSWLETHWNSADSAFLDRVDDLGGDVVGLDVPTQVATNVATTVSTALPSDVPVAWAVQTPGCTFENPSARTTTMTCTTSVLRGARNRPIWISATGDVDGRTVHARTKVSVVRSTTPDADITGGPLRAGATVTLRAQTSNGLPPFTFAWQDDIDSCSMAGTTQAAVAITCAEDAPVGTVPVSLVLTGANAEQSTITRDVEIAAYIPPLGMEISPATSSMDAGTSSTWTVTTSREATVIWEAEGIDSERCTLTPQGISATLSCPIDMPARGLSVRATGYTDDGAESTVTAHVMIVAKPFTVGLAPSNGAVTGGSANGLLLTATANHPASYNWSVSGRSDCSVRPSGNTARLTCTSTTTSGQVTVGVTAREHGTSRTATRSQVVAVRRPTAMLPAAAKIPGGTKVSAVLASGGHHLANQLVSLQTLRDGRWVNVAAARTNSAGRMIVNLRPVESGPHRWSYGGNSKYAASTTPEFWVAAASNKKTASLSMSMSGDPSRTKVSTVLSSDGRALSNQLLSLQVRRDGAWVNVAATRTNSAGRGIINFVPPATVEYRWYYPGNRNYDDAASAIVLVRAR
ncbi:hypothetical protein [Nocardioides sp. AE5]|uniref:hypothetical protein n=1 Tax=Nocardioides sp. AE5 TaxID=2962573 RepID=UPI00288143D6|nr:hypothetical protein [Nocardioides sp. AE5]MDT0200456.1 hypothetical protein [Nocardioides sp. AE5]